MQLNLTPSKVELIHPTSDIKYAWNVYTPQKVKKVLIWGYASRQYNDYQSEIEFFNTQIEIIKNECDKYGILAISVFLPRNSQTTNYPEYKYTPQMMTAETMFDNQAEVPEFFRRPDLEVLKILDILRNSMNAKQLDFLEKILIGGVSAGANFANRFSVLYPNLIKACALFCAGDFMYPTDNLNGDKIDYPYGTNNLENILNHNFDADKFKSIPHYIYVGELETKGPLDWELYFPKLIEEYKQIVGEDALNRTKKYAEFLKNNGNKVKLRIEPDIGHKIAKGVFDDGFEFLDSIN